MELSKIIKNFRAKNNLTMQEFATKANVSKQYISMLETNKNSRSGKPIKPSLETLRKLASAMYISLDDLLKIVDGNQVVSLMATDDEPIDKPQGVKIPILGTVVAGIPITAIEDILGYEEITRDMAKHGDFFALQIQGHSMEPNLWDGDIVIVRSQPTVENNEIAIILVNGDEATVKLVKKSPEGITLIGFNTKVYPPHFYTVHEIETLPVTIVGKVIEGRRRFK